MFSFSRYCQTVFQMISPLPSGVYGNFSCSTSLANTWFCQSFPFQPFCWGCMVSPCGFNLHFPCGYINLVSFSMFIGHLDIPFVKSLIMSFAFVKLGSFLFPLILLYIWETSPQSFTCIANIFSYSVACLFPQCPLVTEVPNSIVDQFISLFLYGYVFYPI